MADSSSLWLQVSEQANRLFELLEDRKFQGEQRDAAVVFMYSRTRRLYMAALLLLKARLPEESAIIGRSLFEAAMCLRELAAVPTDRDALIVGWLRGSIAESEGLLKNAKSVGVDPDIGDELERLKERRKLVDAYARRVGAEGSKPFLTTRDAAIRFGRQEEYCDYSWAHESTHGSEAASVFSTRVEGDTTRLHARTGEASVLGAFAYFVARAMADAAAATYAILAWTPVPDFEEPVSAIKRLMDEHHRTA